jgi:hypothetical protein
MPLFPFIFPYDIIGEPSWELENDAPWWALRGWPRAEKCLAHDYPARQAPKVFRQSAVHPAGVSAEMVGWMLRPFSNQKLAVAL